MRSFVLALLAITLPLLAGCAGSLPAGDPGPERNLAVLSRLSERIAGLQIAPLAGIDSTAVLLTVTPRDHWYIFDAFAAALERRRCRVVTTPPADGAVEVAATRVTTTYEFPRRTWLFGPRVMDRVIDIELRCRVDSAGTLREIRSLQATQRDTIMADDVGSIESIDVPSARGTVPHGSVLDDLVEPLVIAGAAAVAVVLLFSVRS